MEGLPIGQQKKPATHCGYVGYNAETIKVRLHSICFSVKGTLSVSALASNSGDLLKAFIRSECDELAAVPNEQIRLLFRGVELGDNMPLAKLNCEELDLHFLVLGEQVEASGFELALCKGVPCPSELAELLDECSQGLQKAPPVLTEGGCGGTYFLKSQKHPGQVLAVFKPKDEEAGAPQNPRGYLGKENSRYYLPAVASAQRAVREVAAYLLDRGHAKVPMTTLARCRHQSFVPVQIAGEPSVVWKLGAFQAFVEGESSEDFGYSSYSVEDVHRIGILDLRIVNFDRNQGNLLVQDDGRRRLVPIDHGCSLPDRLCFPLHDVAWAWWPQSKEPFSPEDLKYIAELDGEADARMLAETLGLERGCLRLLELSTLWLQVAAAAGCTLHQIASALYRRDPDKPSVIEGVIFNCLASARAVPTGEGCSLSRSITHCHCPRSGKSHGLFEDVQWTTALEETFRRHCLQEFQRLVTRA